MLDTNGRAQLTFAATSPTDQDGASVQSPSGSPGRRGGSQRPLQLLGARDLPGAPPEALPTQAERPSHVKLCLLKAPFRVFPRDPRSGSLRTVCSFRIRAQTSRFHPNQGQTALEMAAHIGLRTVSMSNHPRTERESRLKAMNAMRLPRFEAMSGCRSPDVSGAEDVGRDPKRDVGEHRKAWGS